jgi:hypothetical protein
VAVAVLALGVAAASVSLAIVNAFFVRDLPIANRERFMADSSAELSTTSNWEWGVGSGWELVPGSWELS